MKPETLQILCDTAIRACEIELDGARRIDYDELPDVLLGVINAYLAAMDPGGCPKCGGDDLTTVLDANGEVTESYCPSCRYSWRATSEAK